MKFAHRIISFIFSAVIFMSAFVVFAENGSEQTADPSVLDLTVYVELNNKPVLTIEGNKTADEEKALWDEFASQTISPPFFALLLDHPDITLWLQGMNARGAHNVSITGTEKKYTISAITYSLLGNENYLDPKGMVEQLKDVVTNFEPTGDTMYDRLLSIHDYICKMNAYASEANGALYCRTAYGALVDRRSVCEGYAEAFKLICDDNGIDCVLVTGKSRVSSDGNEEPHMWNYVRMDDGKWYAVDVTWDDKSFGPAGTDYFLVGSDTVINGMEFSKSHEATKKFDKMTIDIFEYPELEPTEYDPENVVKIEYTPGEGNEYYYRCLNATQKELYDAMLAQMLDDGLPSDPNKTPSPAPTDDLVTTEPEDTSSDTTSTDESDTSVSETTTEETTTEETTSEETTTEETTTEETTTEETTTEETTTEETTTEETTTEETTTEETTTEETTTEETTTEETTTEETTTEETTTEETTTEETTTEETTTEETSTSETTSESITTSDTKEYETSEEITLPETGTSSEKVTTVPTTTENTKNTNGGAQIDLYKVVTVIVIVCAIVCLSLVLGVVIIKFAGKHND